MADDLMDQCSLLITSSMINATLQDTTSVTMSSDNDTVDADSAEDEFSILRREMVQTLLDDMVAVDVLDEMNDIIAQSLNDDIPLRRG